MAITVYGAPPNRTHRVLWMLGEGGLEYDLVRLHTHEEIEANDELARWNPNRKVPTIVDGDVTVWDSLAINLYLSERYDILRPEGPVGRAHATQWSFFAQTDLDRHLLAIAKARFGVEEERDEEAAREASVALQAPLAVLDGVLADREYLVGSEFSVADLNVAAVLVVAVPVGVELAGNPNLRRWLKSSLDRPAAREVFAAAATG